MMDTTERGMASPREKMEAENVEMGQAKKFDRPAVIEDCDTLPQVAKSDELAKPDLRFFEDRGFKVRVIMRVNKPWFVAKDVAACIEHSNVTKMCELCRDKDKATITDSDEIEAINESLIPQQMFSKSTTNIALITESGLYRILAKCNLPKCEPFESWIFDTVLPSMEASNTTIEKSQHETHIIHNQNSYSSPDIGIGSQTFCGVRGYEKEGVAYLHIEDVARGLGFTQSQVKNGKEYTSIRWERIDAFLADFGFPPQVGENWSEMATKTLWRWLERLEKARRISRLSYLTNVNVSTSTGAVKRQTKPFSRRLKAISLIVFSRLNLSSHLAPMV